MLHLYKAIEELNARMTSMTKQIVTDQCMSTGVVREIAEHQKSLIGVIEAIQQLQETRRVEREIGMFQPYLPGLEPTSDEEVMEA